MARLPRINIPTIPQHVVQRGNNRQSCFFHRQDYCVYLKKLKEYSLEFTVDIHAYVLMTNHVHLLMTPQTKTGISQLMQSLGRYYVRYINHKYKRSGTLWEGRYKSTLIDSETYFLTASRYIELNPLRANMVETPADYLWSSYRENALKSNFGLITPHPVYLRLGKTPDERKSAYKALFLNDIDQTTLEKIRKASDHTRVLGDQCFVDKIEQIVENRVCPKRRGGDRRSIHFRCQSDTEN